MIQLVNLVFLSPETFFLGRTSPCRHPLVRAIAQMADHDEIPEVSSAPGPMKVSHQEMKAARIDVAYRDSCAHLLIPLNKCRHESPWTFSCGHERHEYERCLYVEHLKSVKRKFEEK